MCDCPSTTRSSTTTSVSPRVHIFPELEARTLRSTPVASCACRWGSQFHRTTSSRREDLGRGAIQAIPGELTKRGFTKGPHDIPALTAAAMADVCAGGNPREATVDDVLALYTAAFWSPAEVRDRVGREKRSTDPT